MMNFGLIGCGHWGRNYIRILNELKSCCLLTCCDSNEQKIGDLRKIYQNVGFFTNYRTILENQDIETVVVATPPGSHYSIVKDCLKVGKNVIAEKPLTLTVEECEDLFGLAIREQCQLLVGYTFLYNIAIQQLRQFVQKGVLGKLYYLHSTRTHLGLVRSDVNAVWDLAPHDVSIFLYLLGEMPISVGATGACFLHEDKEDVAFISLKFPSGIIGNIHVSWLNSNKVREVQVIGDQAQVVFDDLNNLEKLRIFRKRVEVKNADGTIGHFQEKPGNTFADFQYILRDDDIISPFIKLSEPLKNQTEEFINRISNNVSLKEHMEMNIMIIKVMCCIHRSIKQNGAIIKIE